MLYLLPLVFPLLTSQLTIHKSAGILLNNKSNNTEIMHVCNVKLKRVILECFQFKIHLYIFTLNAYQ